MKPEMLISCVQIGKLLTSTLDLNRILEHIMLKISKLVKAQNWSLLLLEEETAALSFAVVVGITPELVNGIKIKLGEGIAGIVAQRGEPIIITDAEHDERICRRVDQATGFITRSIACLPLKIHGKILGVIEVININNFEQFYKEELPVLSILSDYAAIAIENAQYFARIEKMSVTDEYTGLYNARYLHDILERLIKKAKEEGSELAVAFMDIDNFKQVVDTYGHLYGSQVLKEIGKTILGYLGKDDILIKYGGDEYIIILPDKNKESAKNTLEKIVTAIRKSTYLANEKKPIRLTSSSGIAMFPQDAKNKKDLLLKADNMMYRIKRSSKNGVGIS
jgi:diguanylate cyclase (GGDEF)-like protein